jgi:hypothetical protein
VHVPRRYAAAAGVAALAFALYRATMLPGMDLGDTPSFQARVGVELLTPRDGYPLYTAVGSLFQRITGAEAARALNGVSVAGASAAAAVLVLLGAELTGSLLAGIAAALLFASSYTFWSQAVIAEVYALHIFFVALTLLAAVRWARRPTFGALTWLFAVYALSFGHHLSMILLAPGLIFFLLASSPGGWRSMFAPRVLAVALACAAAGSLQYAWTLHTLWVLDRPASVAEGLQRFWFDVTKADWRETMVLEVPRGLLIDHAAMYAFDLEQQFGWLVPPLAVAGLVALWRRNRRQAGLLAAVYLVTFLFAFSYNVGDAHVFYLPSHLIVALLVGPALVWAGSALRRPHLAAVLLVAYAAGRAWRDFPALDRSNDDRPLNVIAGLTAGLDDRHHVLLADLNWQLQNGLSYYGKARAPHVAYARTPPVMLYAPAFVRDNLAIDRRIVLNEEARQALANAYGPLISSAPDPAVHVPRLTEAVDGLPLGTPYVFCILKPTRDRALDWAEIGRALAAASGGVPVRVPDGDYVAIAGVLGRPPDFAIGSNRPFRRSLTLGGVPVSLRMESWLASDTIRRMGFGHVIAARQHTLIVERGVSFAAFDGSGRALRTAYAANIFAPQARYLVQP